MIVLEYLIYLYWALISSHAPTLRIAAYTNLLVNQTHVIKPVLLQHTEKSPKKSPLVLWNWTTVNGQDRLEIPLTWLIDNKKWRLKLRPDFHLLFVMKMFIKQFTSIVLERPYQCCNKILYYFQKQIFRGWKFKDFFAWF